MNHWHSSPRSRAEVQPSGESLEPRSLLTGTAGNTFALVSGSISDPGKPATATFAIDAQHFTLPHREVLLGVDVVAANGSKLKPSIGAIHDAQGKRELPTIRALYGPQAGNLAGSMASAALVRLNPKPGADGKGSAGYSVEISGERNTAGGYLVGYYLPGDVDSDGAVDKTDLDAIRQALGSKLGDSSYNFNADANRDGRITPADLNLARQNLGVQTTVQPIVLANLDPASDSGVRDRITVFGDVIFNGTATPGATITYAEVNGRTPAATTTAAADGTYSLRIPLAEGENRFRVTSEDAFGQKITGEIKPVTYMKPLVPVVSPTTPISPPEPVVTSTNPASPTTVRTASQRSHAAPNAAHSEVTRVQDQAAKLRERLAANPAQKKG